MADLILGSTTAISESGGVLAFPPGHIVQIKYMVSTTGYSVTNSAGYNDATAWDLTITPSSDSNKILYILNTAFDARHVSGDSPASIQITRNIGGASYSVLSNSKFGAYNMASGNSRHMSTCTKLYVDSPATELTCIYRPQYATSTYNDTEAWFGDDTGIGTFDGTWAYAIEFIPSP